MPNMTWEDWETKGEDWKTIYAGIKPVLVEFAKSHNMKLSPAFTEQSSIRPSNASTIPMRPQ